MNYRQELKKIRAFAFDVDGVFSRYMLASEGGQLLRFMNPKDGLALKIALDEGFKVAIITGGVDDSVRERFSRLGVEDIYMGTRQKKLFYFEEFLKKYSLLTEQVLYMGDDLPDYFVMKKAGFSACPLDAVSEIKQIADYICDRPAGEGCVREVVEQVLKVQDRWDNFLVRLQKEYEKLKG